MKKILPFILVLALSLFLISCSSKTASNSSQGDNSLERVKEAGKIVIGVDDSFPPMEYRDKNNKLLGFDVDLAAAIGKKLGVKMEFLPTDWNGVFVALNAKKFDIILSGLSITDERKKTINFSDPYLYNSQIIVVRVNESNIKSKDDLKGKTVGLQLGSTSEDAAKKVNGINIRKYDKNTEAFMDLAAGRIDAVIVDEVVGRYYLHNESSKYKILDDKLTKEPYGIGFRKQDVKLKNEFNKILKELQQDGTMAKLSDKWFGKNITNND